jgi:hypothetical protein
MRGIADASYASLFGLLICAAPLVAGAWFAVRPSERLLSLVRPLTLAAIFSALCSLVLATTNGLLTIGRATSLDPASIRLAAVVVTEGLAPVIASFACMTAAWACVAIGMRRG